MITENPKFLKILIISAFAVIIPASIIGINFYEKMSQTHESGRTGPVMRWNNLHWKIKMIT